MDLVVTILTIFLLIALGTIVFLINDAKIKSNSSVLSEQLEERISNSIESVYAKREEDFKKSSKENIENIIEPFKKRIKEFEEEVRKNTSQQHEFHTKTKLTIDNLIEQTNQITSDANKLTKALSGDSKTQGDYGELKLEMLLEGSGLEENTHYLLQKGFTVKSDGDVSREIPDAVIYLPQNRNIIIDSKFSFTVYNQYCNTDSAEEKQKLGKLLTKNIRDRINDLSNTKYHQIEELNTPDLIFMFLGIDDSLSVALKFDPDLVAYADKKRIALISPSILHISIKMVENLWRLDGQRESVIKVYDEAQKLVDKLGGFTEVMDSLGNSIAQSQKKYDDARNKLIDGKGSVSSRIQGLVSLGSKEAKKLSDD
jgi:DNA recombination protein RmuC